MAHEHKGILRQWLAGIMVWLSASVAFGGSVTATVSPQRVSLGEPAEFTLEIQGDLESEVEFPEIDGLHVLGTSQSTSMTISFGKMEKVVSLVMQLQAEKEGTYKIPPIELTVDGKQEKTPPLELIVEGAAQQRNYRQNAPPNAGGKTGNANANKDDVPLLFAERVVENTTPYVGQAILAYTRLYYRVRLRQEPNVNAPQTADVRLSRQDGSRQYRQEVGGQLYHVYEIADIVVPLIAGNISLEPHKIEGSYLARDRRSQRGGLLDMFGSGFFTREIPIRVASDSHDLQVKPLPSSDKPGDFNGLVGQFTAQIEREAEALNLGETLTVTLVVEGNGVLDGMAAPELTLPDGIKVYGDQPEYEMQVSGGSILGRAVFKWALVPSKPGQFDLGDIGFSYFDPQTAAYERVTVDAGSLEVTGQVAENGASGRESLPANVPVDPAAGKRAVEQEGSDLVALHRKANFDTSHGLQTGQQRLLWALSFVSVFAYGGAFVGRRLSNSSAVRSQRRRRIDAFKNFRRSQEKVEQLIAAGRYRDALHELYDRYRDYLGQKWELHGRALTARDIDRHLQVKGIEPKVRETALNVATNIEKVEFSNRNLDAEAVTAMATTLHTVVKDIEKS